MNLIILLISLSLYEGSLRLEGLSPELRGIIDDRITDISLYPQRNCLYDDWLVGAEFRGNHYYKSYFTSPGPISFGIIFPMHLQKGFSYDISFPISFKAKELLLGCMLDLPRWFKVGPSLYGNDTNPHFQNTFKTGGIIGTTWNRDNFILDINLKSNFYEFAIFKQNDGDITYITKRWHIIQSPSIRFSVNQGKIIYRTIVGYTHRFARDTSFSNFRMIYEKHSLNIASGIIMKVKDSSFATATINLQGLAWNYNFENSNKWWAINFPLGAEWDEGILKIRAGIQFQVLIHPEIDFPAPKLFAGLTINPKSNLTIDVVPKLEDFTNLTEWKLGAAIKFQI